jgi:hypothetical protein
MSLVYKFIDLKCNIINIYLIAYQLKSNLSLTPFLLCYDRADHKYKVHVIRND